MTVRNTRLLRGRVRADVGLGHQTNGTWIAVHVDLDLIGCPEIRAAVDELNHLIEIRALGVVSEAVSDREKRRAPTERTP